MAEAWSEGVRGMTAVAEVIQQRSLEKGRTPLQTVAARKGRIHAFSCLNGTTLDALIGKFGAERDYHQALALAARVRQGAGALPGIARSANHFTRTDERPVWARGILPVAIIGNHAFYRIKRY